MWIIAWTGASGVAYGAALLDFLAQRGEHIYFLATPAAKQISRHELGLEFPAEAECAAFCRQRWGETVEYLSLDNLFAPIASGSARVRKMVVIPCSMGTVARLAQGNADTLLLRAADVQLKEKGRLIIVPRETPLHQGHLENLLKLARLGADIVPAMPAFYHRPQSIADQVNFVVGKVLDLLDYPHDLYTRWGGDPIPPNPPCQGE